MPTTPAAAARAYLTAALVLIERMVTWNPALHQGAARLSGLGLALGRRLSEWMPTLSSFASWAA